jgi:hypothetical protein
VWVTYGTTTVTGGNVAVLALCVLKKTPILSVFVVVINLVYVFVCVDEFLFMVT